MILELGRIPDFRITGSLWGGFTRYAAFCCLYRTRCWTNNWGMCDLDIMSLMWRPCNDIEKTLERASLYPKIRNTRKRGDSHFYEISSCSAPVSFWQFPVQSMTESFSNCRHFRCPDIERVSKARFLYSQVLDTVMGILIQAWITNYIALFYTI